MENKVNRWMASAFLLAMFGVIALAGSRAASKAQGTTNVLVTNTSSQPIPVAARPGTGAYIVSIANAPTVKVSSSATAPVSSREVNNPDENFGTNFSQFAILATENVKQSSMFTPSATLPVVIDSLNCWCHSNVAGEYVDELEISILNSSMSTLISDTRYQVSQLPTSPNDSVFSGNVRLFVPAGGSVSVVGYRHGATTQVVDGEATVSFHTVPMP